MKLREADRRPKHHFEIGDIVMYHGSVKNGPGGKGIVLDIATIHDIQEGDKIKFLYQECQCVFFPKEVDLYKAMRTYSASKALDSTYTQGFKVRATALTFIEKAPEAWFAKITAQDIANLRFTHILDA